MPNRAARARRLFSEWDVQRLILLRQAVDHGHRISEVVGLDMAELYAVVARDSLPGIEAAPLIPYPVSKLLDMALGAASALKPRAMLQALLQGTRTLEIPALFEEFVVPLLVHIDKRVQSGKLRPVHGRSATAQIRNFLDHFLKSHSLEPSGTAMVVTSFKEADEMNALMATITAGRVGWDATYIGASLPAVEIAHAVTARDGRAVLVSFGSKIADRDVQQYMSELRQLLSPLIAIVMVGESITRVGEMLLPSGVWGAGTLRHLGKTLENVCRSETSPSARAQAWSPALGPLNRESVMRAP